jgi:tetratricopeptide (TPR) repeat protein
VDVLSTIYAELGQYDKALAIKRDAFRRDPGYGYHNLVAYLSLNRLEEAQATAEEARARNSDSPDIRFSLYSIAFLRNDVPGMARQVAWGAGKPGLEDVLLDLEADAAAHSGRQGNAREFSRRAVASAERAQEKETAEAGQRAQAALRLSTGRDVQ